MTDAQEFDEAGDEIKPPPPPPLPGMRVQRMGKRWRIVYDDTRNLARFNNGRPVDAGGFLDKFEMQPIEGGGEKNVKTVDGQFEAQQCMIKAIDGAKATGMQGSGDPEAEGIGN